MMTNVSFCVELVLLITSSQ